MKKECFWKDAGYVPSPALAGDEHTDYLVVGGGIGGLLAAHFLLQRGATNIVLIEKNTIGSGSTGHSAGMLVAEIETGSWSAIAQKYGVEGARLYWQAQEQAIQVVRELVLSENMNCEFDEEEFLFLVHSYEERDHIVSERAIRSKIGAENTMLAGSEARDEFGSTYFSQLEKLEKAPSVNPLQLTHEIARHLKRCGVRIYENTALLSIEGDVATTSGGSVRFSRCINALGTAEKGGNMRNLLTTVCVTRPLTSEELERTRLKNRDLFLDMGKRSFHYGKVTSDERLLVGYGDVLDDGHGAPPLHEPHVHSVKQFIERAFEFSPEIEYAWTGRYALVPGILPFFADEPSGIRFGGAGTQMATVALASLAVARIFGEPHSLDPLFEQTEQKLP